MIANLLSAQSAQDCDHLKCLPLDPAPSAFSAARPRDVKGTRRCPFHTSAASAERNCCGSSDAVLLVHVIASGIRRNGFAEGSATRVPPPYCESCSPILVIPFLESESRDAGHHDDDADDPGPSAGIVIMIMILVII